MGKPPTCHVVLVTGDDFEKTQRDFEQIATIARSHGVEAYVADRHTPSQLRLLPLWTQRCLSIAPARLYQRKLLPGRFLCGHPMGKIEEFSILDAAGVPVPKWVEIKPSTILDPQEWGPYVVEKPSFGGRGALVRIRKTRRVRYAPPVDLPFRFGKLGGPMIAQQFIYTGERPTSYRVVTFFGEVLTCYRKVSRDRGNPLRSRWDFREVGGISIVAGTGTSETTLSYNDPVMDLAGRAHVTAFPHLPMLQWDIVQDADTGQCFALECHPGPRIWPLSGPVLLSIQKKEGLDFKGQFGALDRAGKVLATKTRELATRIPWP